MKIGVYDPYLDTMSGGERYMLSIARCLGQEHSVSIFWDTRKEQEIRSEAERKFGMNLDAVTFAENIFTTHTSFLKRLELSREYDLIIVLSDGSIPFLGCRTMIHFQTPVEWVQNSLSNRIKLLHVNKIICNSAYTKRYIDKKFNVTSTILYPPVDLPEKKHLKKEKIILNLGRMGILASGSSYKKQDTLRDAFLKMVEEGLKDWEMVFIVNTTDNEKEIVAEFIASVKGKPVRVISNPDMDTVRSYYEKASIYWHAAGYGEDLNEHPDRAEHFGLSTVEAMHFGAVPIVINAGGQPEIVTNEKDGFLWATEEELRSITKKVIKDTALRAELSIEAEKRAERFSVERFCKELSSIIT